MDTFRDLLELSHHLGMASLANGYFIVLSAHEFHHIASHRVDDGLHIVDGPIRAYNTFGTFHFFRGLNGVFVSCVTLRFTEVGLSEV